MPDPRAIDFHPRLAQALARHIRARPEQELGVLLAHRGGSGQPTVARYTIAIRRAEALSPGLAPDESVLAHAHRQIARHHPEAMTEIVGWYAARPGRGVVPTSLDASAHARLFPSAGRLAVLIDPVADRVAIYVLRPDGGLARIHNGALTAFNTEASPSRRHARVRMSIDVREAALAIACGAGLGLGAWVLAGASAGPFGLIGLHL
jgi:hypothetical protein